MRRNIPLADPLQPRLWRRPTFPVRQSLPACQIFEPPSRRTWISANASSSEIPSSPAFTAAFLRSYLRSSNSLDRLDIRPYGVNRLPYCVVSVGKRNYAHSLWEVRVRRRADQQPVRFAARFFGVRAKPGPGAIARSERPIRQNRGLRHAAFGFAALAANPNFGQIAAGSALVNEQLPPLLRAVGRPIVSERSTSRYRQYDPHGMLEQTVQGQRSFSSCRDQCTCPSLALSGALRSRVRMDGPLFDSSRPCVMNHSGNWNPVMPVVAALGSSFAGGGVSKFDGIDFEHSCKLSGQSRFRNSLAAGRPELQPRNENGIVGQINHRTRAERCDELALPDFTVRLSLPASYLLFLQFLVSQRSSPRDSLQAQHHEVTDLPGISFASDPGEGSSLPDSRSHTSNCFAPPASVGLYCRPVPTLW